MRTPCEHDRLFLGKTIICGFPRVRVRARTAAKSRATAFKASSTGIFPSVVLGMVLRWHCETTQECERPIIRANSRIPAVFSDIRSSSKHKQKPSDKLLFSGQTTFSKPITRRLSGLARPAPWGFGFPVPWAVANPAERPQAAHFRKRNGLGKKPATSRRSGFAPHAAVNGTEAPTNRKR